MSIRKQPPKLISPKKSFSEVQNEKELMLKLELYINENEKMAKTIIEKNKEIKLSKIMLKEYFEKNDKEMAIKTFDNILNKKYIGKN